MDLFKWGRAERKKSLRRNRYIKAIRLTFTIQTGGNKVAKSFPFHGSEIALSV